MIKDLILQVSHVKDVFELVDERINNNSFSNVISLNPENLVIALENENFRKIYFNDNSIVIADGVGILGAAKFLQIDNVSRLTGVDLMCEIVEKNKNKKILFLGGKNGAAEKVVQHFRNQVDKEGMYFPLSDVDKNNANLVNEVIKINPDILFVAFGSPDQELWIDKNCDKFNRVFCMGVGGGFDFVAGVLPRAPKILRNLGFEWLFRLLIEPWRAKRQLKLIKFAWLVFLAKLNLA